MRLLGQDSSPSPLSTPNRAHLSPPRRPPQTNTTRWTTRKRPRSTAWGGGGSSGKHQCGGGHAASRRQNSGCLRLEPAAVSCASCLEAPVCIFASRLSPWPTPAPAAAPAGRDGLAPGDAESPGLKQTTTNVRGPDWAEERARPAEREKRSTLTLRTPVGPRGRTVGPQRRVCVAREKLIQTIDRFFDEPAASKTRRPGYDEEGGRWKWGRPARRRPRSQATLPPPPASRTHPAGPVSNPWSMATYPWTKGSADPWQP